MMHDPFQKLFETMRNVEPDAGFVARTRVFLVSAGPARRTAENFRRKFFEDITFGMALVCASVILVLVGVLYSYVGTNAIARQAVDTQNVLQESQSLSFDIELGEASYFTDSADAVAAVLNEIEGNTDNDRTAGYQ